MASKVHLWGKVQLTVSSSTGTMQRSDYFITCSSCPIFSINKYFGTTGAYVISALHNWKGPRMIL